MSSTKLMEVHEVRKELDPNLRPEKQHAMPKKGITEKPQIGQWRAGLRRRPESDCIIQPSDVTRRISKGSKIATGKTNNSQHTNSMHDRTTNNDKSFSPDVLLHPDPFHKPSPIKQNIDKINKVNQNTGINLDIEGNSPFQEGVISETIQRLDKSFFQNPTTLKDLIDTGNLIHKVLPKQADIDKILHIIQRKVLKGTHLPVEMKDIQAGYLLQDKLPHSKLTIKRLEALSEKYVLLDSLLFRI